MDVSFVDQFHTSDNVTLVLWSQVLAQCLETNVTETLTRCLCADEVGHQLQHSGTAQVLQNVTQTQGEQPLMKWWADLTAGIRQDETAVKDKAQWDLYSRLISR